MLESGNSKDKISVPCENMRGDEIKLYHDAPVHPATLCAQKQQVCANTPACVAHSSS